MKIFETHAHYDDEAFIEDRDALLQEMHKNGVEYIVDIGCSMETSRQMNALAEKYPYVYGTVGVHPETIAQMTEADLEELRILSHQEKILAIGEIGLDYYYGEPDQELQKKWFVRQLQLANEEKLPVVIHSRDAAKDTLEIMKSDHHPENRGVIHCFSYGVEMAREYLKLGYYIGVGGVVTFKNGRKLKEVVAYAPLDQIVLETDSPYLAPVPFRGKRNCSLYLQYVAQQIAEIKQLPVEEVYETTYENGKRLYGIG